MKKTILLSLIAAVLLSLSASAQETDYFQKKNEINVQIDDVFAKRDFLTDLYLYDYDMTYVMPMLNYGPTLGLGYKHHFAKGAIRVKVNVATRMQKFMSKDVSDDFQDDMKYFSHRERFSAGYEFHSNFGRTQVFYGFDAVITIEAVGTETYRNDYYVKSGYTVENTQGTFSYGVKPFLGFKYFISPQFSISSEYHVLLEAYVSKTKHKNGSSDIEVENKSTGFETNFGPLGQLTFSFHF